MVNPEGVATMPERPKHPDKELESVIREAESHGWNFEKRRKYYVGKCACGRHLKTVHMTPSGGRYVTNLSAWFHRTDCWNGREPR